MAEQKIKIIAENRKARHDFTIYETFEAGIALTGTEVKSLRAGRANLKDSYAQVDNGEIYLFNMHISPYEQGNRFNVDPVRARKLLLHKSEMRRFAEKAFEKGFTLVPLKLYFSRGRAKLLVGLCKGKQEFDKRESKKKADTEKGLRMSMMRRR